MDKKSILMIDDVKLNLATAKDVLQNEYILYEASSAQEGFDILNKHIPDLILMDLVMPEMDGYEMIEILKSTRRFMGIPVIILTAHTDSENEVKALELGAADFITKPFVPAVMKRRIETQIELSSYQHSLEKLVQEKVEEVEKLQDALSVGFAAEFLERLFKSFLIVFGSNFHCEFAAHFINILEFDVHVLYCVINCFFVGSSL